MAMNPAITSTTANILVVEGYLLMEHMVAKFAALMKDGIIPVLVLIHLVGLAVTAARTVTIKILLVVPLLPAKMITLEKEPGKIITVQAIPVLGLLNLARLTVPALNAVTMAIVIQGVTLLKAVRNVLEAIG